jgi:hypothetical protein
VFEVEGFALAVKMAVCGLCGCSFLSFLLYIAAMINNGRNPMPSPGDRYED